jgi:hypothetical protein
LITARSLTRPNRRLPELRRAQNRLRELKRDRYARKLCSRQVGEDNALVLLLGHVVEFLACTFSEHLDNRFDTRRAVEQMLRALEAMKVEAGKSARVGSGFPRSVIRRYGTASTNLYNKTRRLPVSAECDAFWQQLGLVACVVFPS